VGREIGVFAVDTELPRAVLPWNFAYCGVDADAAKRAGQELTKFRETGFGAHYRVRVRLNMIDHQGSLVICRGAAPGLPDEWLETELPARFLGCVKTRQIRVALTESNRRLGTVQAQTRAEISVAGTLEKLQCEIKVSRRAHGFFLAVNR
jgi:hypothetical protein